MILEAVCFDLDGTLVDSRAGIEDALRAAVTEVLPGRVLSGLDDIIGPPLEAILRQLLPDVPEAHAAVAAAFQRRYDSNGWRSAKPYPGIPEALDALMTAGIRLDVVTNKRTVPTRLILATPGLARRFTLAVSPDAAEPSHHTKAEALRALLEIAGLRPGRVVYVGDSEDDRHAARVAGCRFVAVEWGYGRAAATMQVSDLGLARSPSELPGLLADHRP